MLTYLWLLTKRAAVLLPGLVFVYLSVTKVIPYLHRSMPWIVAILLVYLVGAYVIVPGLMRVGRLFVRPKHLPLFCITSDGFASDPLNIAIIGTPEQLVTAMEKAGWHVAQELSLRTILATINTIVFNLRYNGMPMSRLYLFGRRQDIGFEKQVRKDGRGNRHHVRFWATTYQTIQSLSPRTIDWENRDEDSVNGRILWVGAASRDVGITFTKQSLQLTHAVDPDTNTERDTLAADLETAEVAKLVRTIRLHSSYQLINFAWSRRFFPDGQMAVLHIKPDI